MNSPATETLDSLAGSQFSSLDLDLDDSRFTVTIDDVDNKAVDIEFVEPVQFHKEREPKLWASLVDSDGTLTLAAEKRIVEHLDSLVRERVTDPGFTTENRPELVGDEGRALGVSFRSEYTPGETFAQWWNRIGYPIIAETTNVTDPGTFNAPYLLTDLAR